MVNTTSISTNEVRDWLAKLPDVSKVRPVEVTIASHVFTGCLYTTTMKYWPTERAVTCGRVKAGELREEHRFYLLGRCPPRTHRVMKWEHGLFIDSRVQVSIGEWYVGGWYSKEVDPTPEIHQSFHPFGSYFQLHEWAPATYGPYEGWLVDTGEPHSYKRKPMQVRFL